MVKVKLQQGWLEGEAVEAATGDGFFHNFFSFKGIPYATPPLGKLRFKAPIPAKRWYGVRQAKEHGPICSQRCIFTNQIPPDCSEDCLYLNVYTPNLKPSAPLAVMVFIHGGGYKSGSGNVNNYGPDFLMSHDVVLVTINYRLEAFGYLCLDTEEVPGNAGMKDQVLALKWVKENISNFGGNPDNVTVFGESAGGASTALHVLSPLSKGLFKRAIPMSGVPLCDFSLAFEPRRRAFVLGKQLGLETKDPNELLEFLQSVPAEKLIDVNPYVLAAEEATNNMLKMYLFTPVVEKDFGGNHFLTESPINILKSGKVNDVDVLIGYTSMETLIGLSLFEEKLLATYAKFPELVVPRKILLEATPTKILEISDRIHAHYFGTKPISSETIKEFISYSSESTFAYDVYNYIKLLANPGKNKRYLYKFSSVSNRNIYGNQGQKYGLIGAAHLDDLMYLFDAKQFGLKLETKEKKLIKQACTLFTNFAKHGDPTIVSTGVQWPEYGKEEFYGDIGDQLTVRQHFDAEAIAFWQSIYDYAALKSF